MRYWIFSLAIIGLITFNSCTNSGAEDEGHEGYIIEGTATNANGQQIFLESFNGSRNVTIDTAKVNEDGQFKLKGFVGRKGLHNLRFGDKKYIFLVLEDGDRVSLNLDFEDHLNYTIKGSKGANAFKFLLSKNREVQEGTQALQQEYKAAQSSPDFLTKAQQIKSQHAQLNNAHKQAIRTFLDTTTNYYAGVFAADMIDKSSEEAALTKFIKRIPADMKSDPYISSLVSTVQKMANLKSGGEAPEINLPDPEGNLLPLSTTRGKITLIDFWASWCRPCRFNNPHLVKLYDEYKDKGFTIYSVSLDRQKDRWVQAIAQDGLVWDEHVSDLKFWQSEAALTYNVKSIPYTILLDENGKIIGKNLRGQALDQKLAEVLN